MARRFSPKRLADQLDRLEVSNREFGKRVSPQNPEGGRTSLIERLSGRMTPRPETIEKYVDALNQLAEERGVKGVTYADLTERVPKSKKVSRWERLRARQDARRTDQAAA